MNTWKRMGRVVVACTAVWAASLTAVAQAPAQRSSGRASKDLEAECAELNLTPVQKTAVRNAADQYMQQVTGLDKEAAVLRAAKADTSLYKARRVQLRRVLDQQIYAILTPGQSELLREKRRHTQLVQTYKKIDPDRGASNDLTLRQLKKKKEVDLFYDKLVKGLTLTSAEAQKMRGIAYHYKFSHELARVVADRQGAFGHLSMEGQDKRARKMLETQVAAVLNASQMEKFRKSHKTLLSSYKAKIAKLYQELAKGNTLTPQQRKAVLGVAIDVRRKTKDLEKKMVNAKTAETKARLAAQWGVITNLADAAMLGILNPGQQRKYQDLSGQRHLRGGWAKDELVNDLSLGLALTAEQQAAIRRIARETVEKEKDAASRGSAVTPKRYDSPEIAAELRLVLPPEHYQRYTMLRDVRSYAGAQ